MVWLLVILFAVAAALIAVLHSRWAAARGRDFLVEWVSKAIDRRVAVEELRVTWLPFVLEARGVSIAGKRPGDRPFATAARVVLEGDPRRLFEPHPVIERLSIETPFVGLLFAEDGTHNLPLPQRRSGARTGRRVVIETLLVSDGEIALDERRLPLALTARQVMARLSGDGPVSWVGTAAAQELEMRIADLEPYLGGLTLKLRLDSRRVELVGGRVRGPDLALRAKGEWRLGERKNIALDLEAETSGALFRRLEWSDLIEGPLHFTGNLGWAPEAWSLQGRVDSSALILDGRPLADVTTDLRLDERTLRLDPLIGTYRGGPLAGDVEVHLGEAPTVAVRARLDGSQLADVLTDVGIGVEGITGTVEGRIEYECATDAPTAGDGWAELELKAVETADSRDLPVTGSVPLTIRDGVVEARALRLETAAAELEGEGTYELRSGRGHFAFGGQVTDAGRLLAALDPTQPVEEPLWRPTAGAGRVEGMLALAPGQWSLFVEPDWTGVTAPGYAADRLAGSLTLTPAAVEGLALALTRPAAALRLEGRVPFDESEQLAVDLEATGWPSEEMQRWLPWRLPVSGPVSGSVRLGGSLAALEGRADVALAPVEAFGLAGDRLVAELDFGPQGTKVDRLSLATPAGEIVAVGSLGAGEAAPLDFTVSSTAIDLEQEPLASLVAGSLRGRLDLTGELGGTWTEPELTAALAGTALALGERSLGEAGSARVAVEWRQGELTAEGALLGLVTVNGGGQLDQQGADLTVQLATEDPVALIQLASESALPAVPGRLRGRLTARGAWQGGLAVSFEADELSLHLAEREVALLEPARVEWRDSVLQIQSLYLGEPATASELFVFGSVPLDGSPLDVKLQTSLAGELAEPWLPGWRLGAGRLEGIGSIRGTLDRPLVVGQGEVELTSVLIPGIPNAIESPRGWLLFDPGRLTFDTVTARFGGGTVRAEGTLDLDGESGGAYELQVSADDVAIRYPAEWWLRGDALAALVSTPYGRQLRGTIVLERAYYVEDVPIGFAQLLQSFFDRRPRVIEETDELFASTELDLLVRGPGALRVRNNVARLDGDVDLALRGSLARPLVFGTVEARPEGTLVYADTEYVLERGELSFANPYRIEPVIDLAARAELRDYDVTLNLSGTLDRLDVAVASDPPLADVDVLALIAGAEVAPGEPGEPAGNGTQVSAAGLLYGQAAGAVGRRFSRLFGLDKFRIDPLTESRGDLSSARVTVGERISRDLYATYSYDPATSDQQVLQVEWQVSRGLTLVATQNGDGSYAIDVRAEKSF